jgi:hypothetical protein
MLTKATEHLVTVARDVNSSDADFKNAVQKFHEEASRLSVEDANEAIAALAPLVNLEDLSRAGFLALLCGAFIERGCDPLMVAAQLTRRLQSLLEMAVTFDDACLANAPASGETGESHADVFETVKKQTALSMPKHCEAWEALNTFWRPAITVFSASAEARAAARDLQAMAARISDSHEAGHWLRLILTVLDDVPILVIEPETKQGVLAQISGVVENFQLNVLIMDGFPTPDQAAGSRVVQNVADVARGAGAQSTEDIVHGAWNLYTWEAVTTDGGLPDPNDYGSRDYWIWNEGVPADIPVFEGRRVILLGPPSYDRTWRSQRMFASLPATFRVVQSLSQEEVVDWLQRMVTAKDRGQA